MCKVGDKAAELPEMPEEEGMDPEAGTKPGEKQDPASFAPGSPPPTSGDPGSPP